MRLTFYSDYSLRLLMYAALKPRALITITGHARAGFARASARSLLQAPAFDKHIDRRNYNQREDRRR